MSHLPVQLPQFAAPRHCSVPASQPIKKSRMSPRRFTVLIIVQVLMIAHLIQWLAMGVTLAPIEPSESMETIKHGVITVGFIFFTVAILSTAILGRWFCGWGCHIVMLQDFCTKLLRRVGVQPKPFRARLLMFIPLALAIYMFIWPAVYRFAIAPLVQPDLVPVVISWKLTTTQFWSSMPGWAMSIPFIVLCGFVTVWFLGQKGYCTYACPYGGLFAPVDELAVGRIRVTDACEGCGHCTAVCTSNVRVHEEVALYKMVVDPGCMKCLDCVSVCPKDALYFGFGTPAVAVERAPTAAKKYDLSWKAECTILGSGLFAFYAVYFPFGESVARLTVPLLFASGIAACFAFMAWKSIQVVRRLPTGFHRTNFVKQGRIHRAGYFWVACTALIACALADTLAVNFMAWRAFRNDLLVQLPESIVFGRDRMTAPIEVQQASRAGLAWYERSLPVTAGGLALFSTQQDAIDYRRAWLHAVLNELSESKRILVEAWDRNPQETTAIILGRINRALALDAESDQFFRTVEAANPQWIALADEHVTWLVHEDRIADAITVAREAAARASGSTLPTRRLSMLLIERGTMQDVHEGIAITRKSLEAEPENAFAMGAIAMGQLRLEHPQDALVTINAAIAVSPNEPTLFDLLAETYRALGDEPGVERAAAKAGELRSAPHSH